jgi:hypothetical protein
VVNFAALGLRQRDGVSCGPAVAVVAGALLDPDYGADLTDPAWFDREQARVHGAANRIWPRALGTTPLGMARTISGHGARHSVRYGWRPLRPGSVRADDMADVLRAVTAGWPVAMLIGNVIPRHWVLIVECDGDALRCFEPSSGEVVAVAAAAVRQAGLSGLGFSRTFAFVLPRYRVTEPNSNI